MSIEHMTAVRKQSKMHGSARLLMLALADYANDDGVCWPGVKALSEWVNLGERNVRYLLRYLEAQGEIATRIGGHGPRSTSTYQLLIGPHMDGELRGQTLPPSVSAKGATQRREGGKIAPVRGQALAPDPLVDPSLDPPYLPTYRAGRENDPITLWDDAVRGAPRRWRSQLDALGIRAIERGRADMLPAAVSYVAARDLTTPYPYLAKVVEGCLETGEEPGGKLPEKIRAAAGARTPQRGAFAGKWAQNTLR